MAEAHVLSALRDKRSELSGLIQELEKKIGLHRANLSHLDSTLRLFCPDIDPGTILPRLPRARNIWFRPGECVRMVCDLLRDAPVPVPTTSIVRHLCAAKGMEDERSGDLFHKTVLAALRRAGAMFEPVKTGGELSWRIAGQAADRCQ
jgi:hypothetical protein